MRRRDFITLVAGPAGWPLVARAERAREPAINVGVLTDMSGLYATLSGAGSVAAAEMAAPYRWHPGDALSSSVRNRGREPINDIEPALLSNCTKPVWAPSRVPV